jgi:hypothetical protein
MKTRSASDDEEVLILLNRDPEGDLQAGAGFEKSRRFTRRSPNGFVVPVGSRKGVLAGMEEYR